MKYFLYDTLIVRSVISLSIFLSLNHHDDGKHNEAKQSDNNSEHKVGEKIVSNWRVLSYDQILSEEMGTRAMELIKTSLNRIR